MGHVFQLLQFPKVTSHDNVSQLAAIKLCKFAVIRENLSIFAVIRKNVAAITPLGDFDMRP